MLTISVLLSAIALGAPQNPYIDPHALVASGLSAMHLDAHPSSGTLQLSGIQQSYMLGNAERAEGPWRAFYTRFTELRDEGSPRLRRTEIVLAPDGSAAPPRTFVLADSVAAVITGASEVGLSRGTYEDMIDGVEFSPDWALRLAAATPGLHWVRSDAWYGVTYDVVSFPWRNGQMSLELSRETHLPIAVMIKRPYPDNFRWGPFGDITMTARYLDWQMQSWGGWWPMQQQVSWNGQPLRDVTIGSVKLDAAASAADSFVVTDSARTQYAAGSRMNFSRFRLGMRGQPSELRPGIVRVPDFWAMTLVKQPDGVVIFESHISGQYFRDVVAEAHRRWPGAPIKALVMTSDPWAHMGGFREAVAMGIPIYVNPRSIPFLTSLARAPHTMEPDLLQRTHKAPRFIPVSQKTVVGTGANRFELYPVGGPYAERMTMAYFPEYKLLYGADLVAVNRPQANAPADAPITFEQTEATDLRAAVARERLAVDSVFCVQNYPHPYAWKDFSAR
jgi:hypothetical protein